MKWEGDEFQGRKDDPVIALPPKVLGGGDWPKDMPAGRGGYTPQTGMFSTKEKIVVGAWLALCAIATIGLGIAAWFKY